MDEKILLMPLENRLIFTLFYTFCTLLKPLRQLQHSPLYCQKDHKMIKSKTIFKLFILMTLLIAGKLFSQDQNTLLSGQLHLITLQTEEGIILRWGPSDAESWQRANNAGFRLQRAKVPSNSKELENYAYETLSGELFRPLPAEAWESIIDADAYVASAWASLYEVRPEIPGDLATRLSNQKDLNEKAFFLAMLAADHSAVSAEALGLRYLDKSVENGAAYIYRITIEGEESSEALSYLDLTFVNNVQTPQAPETISEEKAVLLKWMVSADNNAYTSYHVERSEKISGPYTRLTVVPYIHLNNTDGSATETPAFFKDSVETNYKPYYYRLIGITPFATESKGSVPVLGMGLDLTPPDNAVQITANADQNNHVVITWTKTVIEGDFAGFVVGRADSYEGPFEPVHSGLLGSQVRTFKHSTPDLNGYNYYAVSVVDTAGNIAVSESAYAFFRDTVPPPPPVGLSGSIDSTGLVTVTWNSVNDPTLIGYRVYFSNSPDHSFIMRSGDLIQDTFYTERIMLQSLSEKILYRVASVDAGYGHSDYSEMLELKKPDIIPPTSGVFKSHQLDGTTVSIQWAPSSSIDLASQELWRKEEGKEWTVIKTFDTKTDNYTDMALELKKTYSYALRGKDDDGLLSEFSSLLSINTPDSDIPDPVKDLKVESDKSGSKVLLSWTYQNAVNYSFIIYKGESDSNPISYDYVEGITQASDFQVQTGEIYQYRIRVMDKSGNESILSVPVSVIIPQSNK